MPIDLVDLEITRADFLFHRHAWSAGIELTATEILAAKLEDTVFAVLKELASRPCEAQPPALVALAVELQRRVDQLEDDKPGMGDRIKP